MKIIYAMIPICLFSACKQSTPSAEDQRGAGPVAAEQPQSPETMTPVEKTPPVTPTEPKPDKSVGDARYLGMAKEDAAALAKKEGQPSRIVSEDGKVGMMTMDHRPDRLNFTVVDGKITKVTRG